VVRPSYVLGGRAMEVVYGEEELNRYMVEAVNVEPDHPVLIDQYLENATEVDVDALCDGTGRVVIGGLMEHIEPAGVHSGDSACALPAVSLEQQALATIRQWSEALALALQVNGLINLQFAIKDGDVYIIEANPRASRTVPYVSKATGLPLAKISARCMAGRSLADQGVGAEVIPPYYSVKEAVFPFIKFPGADTILGPEMKSTGEVMGVGATFGEAFIKSQLAAGDRLPVSGKVFVSVRDADKRAVVPIAQELVALGFHLVATRGTAAVLEAAAIPVRMVYKVKEGRPHIVDMIKNREVVLVINTTEARKGVIADSRLIRVSALQGRVPYYTTIAGANAAVEGLKHMQSLEVYDLQGLHKQLA